MYIVKIANYFFSLYFLNVVFKSYFPEVYNNIIIKVSYFSIYCFTKSQMIVMQTQKVLTKQYNNLLCNYPSVSKKLHNFSEYFIKTQDIEYINNGEIIDTTNKKYLLENYKKNDSNSENDTNNTTKKYDLIIYTNRIKKRVLSELPVTEIQYKCEDTNYKFILIEIIINNEIVKVDFITNEYNYMLINNVINKEFIIYFLKKNYPKYVKSVLYYGGNLDKYIIKILDQDVNEIVLNQNNYLTFKKDNYELSLLK